MSEVVEPYPEVHVMDLNPVIARPVGVAAVDARIVPVRDSKSRTRRTGWPGVHVAAFVPPSTKGRVGA